MNIFGTWFVSSMQYIQETFAPTPQLFCFFCFYFCFFFFLFFCRLEKGLQRSLDIVHGTLLLLPVHLIDTRPSHFRCHLDAANRRLLFFSHARVQIDVLDGNPHATMRWVHKPTVDFPSQVESQQERSGKVGLEEGFRVEGGAPYREQSDVELGYESADVDEEAEV